MTAQSMKSLAPWSAVMSGAKTMSPMARLAASCQSPMTSASSCSKALIAFFRLVRLALYSASFRHNAVFVSHLLKQSRTPFEVLHDDVFGTNRSLDALDTSLRSSIAQTHDVPSTRTRAVLEVVEFVFFLIGENMTCFAVSKKDVRGLALTMKKKLLAPPESVVSALQMEYLGKGLMEEGSWIRADDWYVCAAS